MSIEKETLAILDLFCEITGAHDDRVPDICMIAANRIDALPADVIKGCVVAALRGFADGIKAGSKASPGSAEAPRQGEP